MPTNAMKDTKKPDSASMPSESEPIYSNDASVMAPGQAPKRAATPANNAKMLPASASPNPNLELNLALEANASDSSAPDRKNTMEINSIGSERISNCI